MQKRIVWVQGEREAVEKQFRRLRGTSDESIVTDSWIVRNWLPAQVAAGLPPERQRKYSAPKERAALQETLSAMLTVHNFKLPVKAAEVPAETHVIEGVPTPMSATDMVKTIQEWLPIIRQVEEHRRAFGTSVFDDALAHQVAQSAAVPPELPVSPQVSSNLIPKPPKVKPERKQHRVVVGGVHDKYRHELINAFPNIQIDWIESHEREADVRRKCNGRYVILCTIAVNGGILRTAKGYSQQFAIAHTAARVHNELANFLTLAQRTA